MAANRSLGARRLTLAFALLAGTASAAQEARVLEMADGTRIEYTLREFTEDAHRADPAAEVAGAHAFDAALRITRHLAAGDLEAVSLLSNAPKARFERLREGFGAWAKEDFARAFGRYFEPGSRLIGEAAIGGHRLLMWYLKDTDNITAYYFVNVDGRWLLDDVPNETRARLRHVLEAHRAGLRRRSSAAD